MKSKQKNKSQSKPPKLPKAPKTAPEPQPPELPASPEAQVNGDPGMPLLEVRLQQRYEILRQRADVLLEEADRDQSFDRSLRLEQFLDRLRSRIQELASTPETTLNNPKTSLYAAKPPALDELSLKELQKLAKEQRLRGYSRLTKQELIRKLS